MRFDFLTRLLLLLCLSLSLGVSSSSSRRWAHQRKRRRQKKKTFRFVNDFRMGYAIKWNELKESIMWEMRFHVTKNDIYGNVRIAWCTVNEWNDLMSLAKRTCAHNYIHRFRWNSRTRQRRASNNNSNNGKLERNFLFWVFFSSSNSFCMRRAKHFRRFRNALFYFSSASSSEFLFILWDRVRVCACKFSFFWFRLSFRVTTETIWVSLPYRMVGFDARW